MSLKSDDFGKHLLGVQDLLQKHSHAETEISALADRAKTLISQAQKFVTDNQPDSASIKKKQEEMKDEYTKLQQLAQERFDKLKVSLLRGDVEWCTHEF